jgi:hypothetical protein
MSDASLSVAFVFRPILTELSDLLLVVSYSLILGSTTFVKNILKDLKKTFFSFFFFILKSKLFIIIIITIAFLILIILILIIFEF